MINIMKRRGFTIVELLVVITIMGALLILNVVNLRGSQISARDAERKVDIESIAANLETFYVAGSDTTQTVGRYPSTMLISGSTSSFPVKVLVVGGGGNGGRQGGGGGGGVLYNPNLSVSINTYNVTVGSSGSSSTFSTMTAQGGGAGGYYGSPNGVAGSNGGSGGGGGSTDGAGVGGAGGSGTTGQGYSGGSGIKVAGGGYPGGGGGGAGGIGTNGINNQGGNGGVGVNYSTVFGTSVGQNGWFGGGGAGTIVWAPSPTRGIGGNGGGGQGGLSTGATDSGATPGMANTGGGGGGSENSNGTSGGSGIVIISYPSASLTAASTGTVAITYTDSNNQNPRSTTAYAGGYTIHTFTGNGTFAVTAFTSYATTGMLRDLDTASITAPGVSSWTQTFIAATNTAQSTDINTGITPRPSINQYVYQPLQTDGSLCTYESQECRKFNLYYHLESDDTVYMVTSKNQ